jgi:HAD superfamily hydrolase (TIGR01509 family)
VPEPFDVVLLDLYDTIVWSEWARLRDLIARRLGVDTPRLTKAFTDTRPARGVGANDDVRGDMAAVLVAVGLDPEPALVEELVDLERTELDRGVHLYDDVFPTLAELRARGVKTALVSNCSHSTRPVVDRLGLEEAFDQVVLSYEVKTMKPDPAIYRITLERLDDAPPARGVFVDDQPQYCDGGAAVGLATRLILRANEDAPADTHGHQIVTDLQPLL